MNKVLFACFVFLLTPALVQAQSSEGHSAQGYAFFAPGREIGCCGGSGKTKHIGGGMNYWVHSRVGLRTEFRYHLTHHGDGLQFWQVRFGLTFRGRQ